MAAQAMAPTPMQLLAIGLLLVGFAFKVSAVPFHMWTPDAYEGAPPAVTGFMSTGVKAAAFAAFVRVFLSAFEPLSAEWAPVLWVVAAATMIVGTVVGVAQTSVKRMLAYSSIAHGGYLLVALVAANDVGKGAMLFYLLTLRGDQSRRVRRHRAARERRPAERSDRATTPGSGTTHPALAALMTVFLLSLGGFPPSAGFIAKWYVFSAGDQGRLRLAGDHRRADERRLGLLLPARRRDDVHDADAIDRARFPPVPRIAGAALVVSAILIFYLGILPTRVLDWAAASIGTIF